MLAQTPIQSLNHVSCKKYPMVALVYCNQLYKYIERLLGVYKQKVDKLSCLQYRSKHQIMCITHVMRKRSRGNVELVVGYFHFQHDSSDQQGEVFLVRQVKNINFRVFLQARGKESLYRVAWDDTSLPSCYPELRYHLTSVWTCSSSYQNEC